MKVVKPAANVYISQSLNTVHQTNEQTKKQGYYRRVKTIDRGSLTPLVFAYFGAMSCECSTFYNKLAEMIAEKRNELIEKVKSWMR